MDSINNKNQVVLVRLRVSITSATRKGNDVVNHNTIKPFYGRKL